MKNLATNDGLESDLLLHLTIDHPTGGWQPALAHLTDGRVLVVGGLEDGGIHHPELGGQLAPPVADMEYFQ